MIENLIRDALTWFTAHRIPEVGPGYARQPGSHFAFA